MHDSVLPTWPAKYAVILATCAFILNVHKSSEARENLVPNSSFEQTAKIPRLPADWTVSWRKTRASDTRLKPLSNSPDFALDSVQYHSGTHSVRIRITRSDNDLVLTAPLIATRGATKIYRASVWVKTQHMKNMTARLCAVYLDARGKWLGANYGVCVAKQDGDWRQLVGLFQPKPGTRSLRLRLWVNFERQGTGTVWFDDVQVTSTTLRALPILRYVDSASERWTAEDREFGYALFTRPIVETIYPDTKPTRTDECLSLQVCGFPTETTAASLCVRAISAITDMHWQVSELHSTTSTDTIPSQAIHAHPVRCLVRQGQSRWGILADRKLLQPVYIQQTDRISVPAATTQQLWLTVSVPRPTRAGEYRGTIALIANGRTRRVPIIVSVYPFSLPEVPEVMFGMYARVHRNQKLLQQNFLDMRQHGMTTVGVCCPLGATITHRNGQIAIEFSKNDDLVRAVAAYQQAHFPEPMVWLMGSDILHWCLKQGPLDSDAFASAYRAILVEILRYAKQQHWPPIIFQPIDEPFGHPQRMPEAKRCLEIMKTIPNLRTEEDGPNGGPHLLEQLYDYCDILVYHDGPWVDRKKYDADAWQRLLKRTAQDNKSVWFYNIDLTGYHPEAMRFGYGFGMHVARGTGMLEWAYMYRYRADRPDEAYSDPKIMFFRYPTTTNNHGGPSIGWEAAREGIIDYKLLHLFFETVHAARACNNAKRTALAQQLDREVQAWLARIHFDHLMATAAKGHFSGPIAVQNDGTTTVSGKFKMANGWSFRDYEQLRRFVANAIVKLGAD